MQDAAHSSAWIQWTGFCMRYGEDEERQLFEGLLVWCLGVYVKEHNGAVRFVADAEVTKQFGEL